MIGIPRILGMYAIIPTTVLLTVSFFVLVVLRKTEGGLKTFGYVIAVLLWIAAALVFSTGIYAIATGKQCGMPMMKQMMEPPMMPRMPHR